MCARPARRTPDRAARARLPSAVRVASGPLAVSPASRRPRSRDATNASNRIARDTGRPRTSHGRNANTPRNCKFEKNIAPRSTGHRRVYFAWLLRLTLVPATLFPFGFGLLLRPYPWHGIAQSRGCGGKTDARNENANRSTVGVNIAAPMSCMACRTPALCHVLRRFPHAVDPHEPWTQEPRTRTVDGAKLGKPRAYARTYARSQLDVALALNTACFEARELREGLEVLLGLRV